MDTLNIIHHHLPHLKFSFTSESGVQILDSDSLVFYVYDKGGFCYDKIRNRYFHYSEGSLLDNLYSLLTQYNDSIPY